MAPPALNLRCFSGPKNLKLKKKTENLLKKCKKKEINTTNLQLVGGCIWLFQHICCFSVWFFPQLQRDIETTESGLTANTLPLKTKSFTGLARLAFSFQGFNKSKKKQKQAFHQQHVGWEIEV